MITNYNEYNDFILEKEIIKIFEELSNNISNIRKTNESVALTIAGTALALPEITKLIGIGVKKLSQLMGFSGKSGEKIIKFAEKIHHKIIAVIQLGVKKLGVKDEKIANKVANGIFYLVIASFMISSGLSTVSALNSSQFSIESIEGALTAVKNKEIISYLMNIINKA